MVIAGVLVAGFASAALVSILSNYTTTTATVGAPVEMIVNDGANGTWTGSGNTSLNITTTGGSDFTFTTVAKNNANNSIDGYPVFVVVAPNGKNFTGREIKKVMFGDKNYGPWAGNNMIDITNNLYIVGRDGNLYNLSTWTGDENKLVLFFDNNGDGIAQTYPLPASSDDNWNVLTMTPNSAIAPGVYQIYSQYVYDLAAYAIEQY